MMIKRSNFKKVYIVLLTIISLFIALIPNQVNAALILAERDTKYYISNSPVIFNFKTLRFANDKVVTGGYLAVPVWEYFNYFGDFSYEISEDGKSITIISETDTYKVYSGTKYMIKNGKMILSPAISLTHKGDIYASITVMSIALGIKTRYNEITDTISLTDSTFDYSRNYTDDDLYWLARIVYAESGHESYEGMVAVANVVLNRVKHNGFPNSIYGVIFDHGGGNQFTPVMAGTIYNEPSEMSIAAARDALNGYNNIGPCLFFFNPRLAKSTWIRDTCNFFMTIGNHDFYY